MIWVVTFLWGDKYETKYVDRLSRGVMLHLDQPHKFVVVTDRSHFYSEMNATWRLPNPELTKVRGCFARLRLFDLAWLQSEGHGVSEGDRIVSIDLDSVITGPLDILFDRPELFLILKGANAVNPCPYNGSLWMLRAGYRQDVWSDFSLEAAKAVPHHEFPDDQAWLAHKLPEESGWQVGPASGVYAFKKPGWPEGDALPEGARAVFFPGNRDPSQFKHLDWVKENWR